MDDGAALAAYYERDEERDRLGAGLGLVEFERTVEIVSRTLPPPPAVVADIGGGPGRYTAWLHRAGYKVIHRDLMPHHVDHVRRDLGDAVDTAVADARALDLADASVDAVLLMGPLYHLRARADRVKCLEEAHRILRPGGRVYAAVITRWAARLHGVLIDRVHLRYPVLMDVIDGMEQDGWMAPLHEASFTAYAHTPDDLAAEVVAAGLDLESLVTVEGIAFALGDLEARLADPVEKATLYESIRAVESVPSLLGLGPHLLAVATR